MAELALCRLTTYGCSARKGDLWKKTKAKTPGQPASKSYAGAVQDSRSVTDRRTLLLMQLYVVPRCQRPATCRLPSQLPRTARARPFRDIRCADRPRHGTVGLRRQLGSSALAASAGDTQQVDRAAVGPFRQLGLWTAVDAAATVGSIVGALAFFITSEAVFASIPVILPLVAWYAGRQKEGLQVEVSTALFQPRLLSCQCLLAITYKIGQDHIC